MVVSGWQIGRFKPVTCKLGNLQLFCIARTSVPLSIRTCIGTQLPSTFRTHFNHHAAGAASLNVVRHKGEKEINSLMIALNQFPDKRNPHHGQGPDA